MDRESLESCLVRIVNADGHTVGAGFVVSTSGLIATCAHVVDSAGGSAGGSVTIEFAKCKTGTQFRARVDAYFDRSKTGGDIAILQFEGDLPPGIESATLGASTGLEDEILFVMGYPNDSPVIGRGARPRVIRRAHTASELQLQDPSIERGFSGSPLLHDKRGQVVGMISAVGGERGVSVFAVPAERIAEVCPPLKLNEGTDDVDEFLSSCQIGEQYDPNFYVPRLRAEAEIKRFLDLGGSAFACLITGDSGTGKTAMLCDLMRRYTQTSATPAPIFLVHPCRGRSTPPSVREIEQDLSRRLSLKSANVFEAAESAARKKGIVVVIAIDGLNEVSRSKDARKTLERLLVMCHKHKTSRIRVMITTQPDAMPRDFQSFAPFLHTTLLGETQVALRSFSDDELGTSVELLRKRYPSWPERFFDLGNYETRDFLREPRNFARAAKILSQRIEQPGKIRNSDTMSLSAAAGLVAKSAIEKVEELPKLAEYLRRAVASPTAYDSLYPTSEDSPKHYAGPEWHMIEFVASVLHGNLAEEGIGSSSTGGELTVAVQRRVPKAPSWYKQALRKAIGDLGLPAEVIVDVAKRLLEDRDVDRADFGTALVLQSWARHHERSALSQALPRWTSGPSRLSARTLSILPSLVPEDPELLYEALSRSLARWPKALSQCEVLLQRYVQGESNTTALVAMSPKNRFARAADSLRQAIEASGYIDAVISLPRLTMILVAEVARSGTDNDVNYVLDTVRVAWSKQRIARRLPQWKVWFWILVGLLYIVIRFAMSRLPPNNPQSYGALKALGRLSAENREIVAGLCAYFEPRPLDEELRRLIIASSKIPNSIVMSLGEVVLIIAAQKNETSVLEFLEWLNTYAWEQPLARAALMQSSLYTYFHILNFLDVAEQDRDDLATRFKCYHSMLERMLLTDGKTSPRGEYVTGRGTVSSPHIGRYCLLREKLKVRLPELGPDIVSTIIKEAFESRPIDYGLLEILVGELKVLATEWHAWHLAILPLLDIAKRLNDGPDGEMVALKVSLTSALEDVRPYMPEEVDSVKGKVKLEVRRARQSRPKPQMPKGEEGLSTAFEVMLLRFVIKIPLFSKGVRSFLVRALDQGAVMGWLVLAIDELLVWLQSPESPPGSSGV